MTKITIGKKEYEAQEMNLRQDELYFYEENPRIHSTISNFDTRVDIQSEIEKVLKKKDYVKELKVAIEQNGGLIDPIIVAFKNERYTVLEGNSRLAAYRMLAEKDPIKWQHIKCLVLPSDISDDDIFTLLGQYHIVGRKDWSVFEQAAYLYRQREASNVDILVLAKKVGMKKGDVEHYLEVYTFMKEHDDLREEKWSYYNEYLKSRGLKKYRQTSPQIDEVFAKKVRSGEIAQAVDVRDKLSQISRSESRDAKKIMQSFIDETRTLDEAWEVLEATGKTGSVYKKIEGFRKLVTDEEFPKRVMQEATSNSSIRFEINKIYKALEKLLNDLKGG